MPGCAAVGCNNRSEKGHIMKCFPRDPKLRKIWQERVARADWVPSNNSFLCHVHFEPQEWSITQSGRIRLRKNAIPTIFNITSTRKSPKKRIKLPAGLTGNNIQNSPAINCLDKQTGYLFIKQLEAKGSDFQNIDELSLESVADSEASISSIIMDLQEKENNEKFDVKKDPDTQNDVIVISDDNLPDVKSANSNILQIELKDKTKESNPSTIASTENSMSVQIADTVVKKEVKSEIIEQSMLHDSYDEIEEKLKQICDGSTEDENCIVMDKVIALEREKEEKLNNVPQPSKAELLTNNTNTCSDVKKNEIGHVLTEKEENVEIIFGVESGDEKENMCHSTLQKKDPVEKSNTINNSSLDFNGPLHIKEEKKVFTEDIEENFSKEEVHVIPNMRAAMKRKKRTREEIMKSIKKSMRSTSDQELSLSNSNLSDAPDSDTETVYDSSRSPCQTKTYNNDDPTSGTAKFVIKVTGDLDDVTEIMDELSVISVTKPAPQRHMNEGNDDVVSSVITVYSSLQCKDSNDSDTSIQLLKNEYTTPNTNMSLEAINLGSPYHQCNSSSCRHSLTSIEDEDRKVTASNNSYSHLCLHGQHSSVVNTPSSTFPNDYEELLERIKLQEDVISKLTDQIIVCKENEDKMKGRSTMLDVRETEMPSHKMNTRSSTAQSVSSFKKNLEWKRKLIEDLSNRVNYFEETNKKLMKTVTLESQQRRSLEAQLKQKDNRIKELNWKLEKASKYLERAEKNANTYRRKMMNMQTIMRRKKLLDEKMSKFNEILADNPKQQFSDKDIVMALEIRKSCGKEGYDKLLSYGFSLPPLPVLDRKLSSENFSDFEGNNETAQDTLKGKLQFEKTRNEDNDVEMETKDSRLSGSTPKEVEISGETVTGTVQDIFDENNDGDDFSTNELREHFILQLNAVM